MSPFDTEKQRFYAGHAGDVPKCPEMSHWKKMLVDVMCGPVTP